jgi:hypothetical protein
MPRQVSEWEVKLSPLSKKRSNFLMVDMGEIDDLVNEVGTLQWRVGWSVVTLQ